MNPIPLLAAALLALLPLLSGCDARAEDKEEIRQLWVDFNEYNNTSNGSAIVEVFTQSSFDHNVELLKIGLDGTPQQVRDLPPMDRQEVLRMRLRATRAELEKLDGRGYVRFATSRGWYVTPPHERSDDTLEQFRFNKDATEAWARVHTDGERTRDRIRFIKEGGRWRYDEPQAMREWDKYYFILARDEGISVDQLILNELADELNREIPESVWEPMPG